MKTLLLFSFFTLTGTHSDINEGETHSFKTNYERFCIDQSANNIYLFSTDKMHHYSMPGFKEIGTFNLNFPAAKAISACAMSSLYIYAVAVDINSKSTLLVYSVKSHEIIDKCDFNNKVIINAIHVCKSGRIISCDCFDAANSRAFVQVLKVEDSGHELKQKYDGMTTSDLSPDGNSIILASILGKSEIRGLKNDRLVLTASLKKPVISVSLANDECAIASKDEIRIIKKLSTIQQQQDYDYTGRIVILNTEYSVIRDYNKNNGFNLVGLSDGKIHIDKTVIPNNKLARIAVSKGVIYLLDDMRFHIINTK